MGLLQKLFGPKTDFQALKDNGAILLDVRNPGEVKSAGIKSAVNIPLQNLSSKEITKLKSKNKPVVCVCASGVRSNMAKSKLKAAGVEAYNGGAWSRMKPYFG
ncbi:rhodanese-like domain-containing protein [Lishizhenia sp.]|uniref:rhodanese-like domain-containing protein n=1 Tax=Lishizhenia sp. TaxID=2497594 RepID=UPI00299D879B|nr:rhodanese-like domain-containing protein [Lishizhenia sp.]MDX1445306.1 rhodanese-like domain-containing protein [Lishizhenia sp.]